MKPALRRCLVYASVGGVLTSAVGTALKLAQMIDWPWWLIAAPAAATLATWLFALAVLALVVRGMIRHAPEFP